MISQPDDLSASRRARWLPCFLWIAILGWGAGFGAKLFELLVVVRAWGSQPPDSLALLPYGPKYPVDPGGFFQPLSVVILVGALGSLVCGWRRASRQTVWLWLPVLMFLVIWILTPTVFWPILGDLFAVARGRVVLSSAEAVELVRRWLCWDWFRWGLITVGFISSVRALSDSRRQT